jgi:uncharacterized repeat protein (TIGR01451 family)
MSTKNMWIGLLVLVFAVTACGPQATATPSPTQPPQAPTPTQPPAPSPTPAPATVEESILISEVLPGVFGVNNNLEFVELYNAGSAAVDLNGWSLWYRLADNRDEELIYAWEGQADIPGHGHTLLVKADQDVGNVGDGEYTGTLFEKKGGLALRNPEGQTVDSLVWGDGPASYVAGSPAPVPEDGASLERKPGGEAGNGSQRGDNAADFALNPTPHPQNSGDPLTPLPDQRLTIRLEVPATVEPGAEVAYTIEIQNQTTRTVHDVRVVAPIPAGFEVLSTPEGGSHADGWFEWILGELAEGATETGTIRLQSPWTYLSTRIQGAYVEAADWPMRTYSPLASLAVEGGAIPIATARTLTGKTVTVEGVAGMYTDGFYAGTTGTKFYLQDPTGGIQVYCPGGMGLVEVQVGDWVRVTGGIEIYRDSVEIVPSTYPDDVEVIEGGGHEPEPTPATLRQATSDASLLGQLVVVEGTATRSEEFTYSYEVDLMDDQGELALVYIDKITGVTAEPLDLGKRYRVTGILELYNGIWEVQPRFQTDLAEIFPPELMLEMRARNSVLPSEIITYTLSATNHTAAPLTSVRIAASPPLEGVSVAEVLDGGNQQGGLLVWTLSELAPDGGSATVRYRVTVDGDASGQIMAGAAVASAAEWPVPVGTDPLLTFVGGGVPIWAIQGPGMASPYVRDQATTEGIVIGVFPELQGFWIQELETDGDPATSAGLFVLTGEMEAPVAQYDRVRVRGKVRELSGQTLLHLQTADDLTVLGSGSDLPPAIELDPPLDEEEALVYLEALEGMLVQVSEPAVAVGPTSRYGETPLVRTEWGIERVMKGDPTGMLIFVDDGSSTTHYDASTLAFALKSGDLVVDIVGPLAYTYEEYKVEPIAPPVIRPADRPLPVLEPAGPDQFSIATFNVENLFDTVDPHPSDPPLLTRSQYQLDLTKTGAAIVAMGTPTIVGLQEVENIGILEDLTQQDALIEVGYIPVLIEGTDSRGIDVGYLVQGDRATLEGAVAYAAPDGLTSRPPLLITVTLHLEAGDTTLYVLNNHFTSMSGGEKPTEPRRTAQAAWNATLVERILADEPDAPIVVLGDLNSFYDSPPLDELRAIGLRHVYEFVEPDRPYSSVYLGESETLDHILVTPALYEHLVRVEAAHINADYPLPAPDDPSARHVSDHDPIVATFSFR